MNNLDIDRWKQTAIGCTEELHYCLFKTGTKIDVAASKGSEGIDLLGLNSRIPLATITLQEAIILSETLVRAVKHSQGIE
jgi:hypothetical protein